MTRPAYSSTRSPGTRPQYVPFGRDSTTKDVLGISEAQLKFVVGMMAGEALGLRFGALGAELDALTGNSSTSNMMDLVRRRWVEQVGVVAGGTAKLWRATARAWQILAPGQMPERPTIVDGLGRIEL